MAVVYIENESLRVGVAPTFGARVVSLVRKATGREWMTQGPESRNTGEDAHYMGAEAVGWDECFPTVSPWDGAGTAWGRRLRDHGDLWGRPSELVSGGPTAITLRFSTPQFRFTRELRLEGASLVARYEAENLGTQALPYLWALHALLAVADGDRIELPGVDRLDATYLSLGGQRLDVPSLVWPGPDGTLPFGLDVVQPKSAEFAGKFFASGQGRRARVGQAGDRLEIAWAAPINDLGIWLTYGGWPALGGNREIALEPTSARADHVGEAIAAGAAPLEPGERRAWWVRLTVGD